MKYHTRVTRLVVLPEGKPLYAEAATTVEIDDEAAGEFVIVRQDGRTDNSIAIDPDEWPELRAAIDRLVGDCKESESHG